MTSQPPQYYVQQSWGMYGWDVVDEDGNLVPGHERYDFEEDALEAVQRLLLTEHDPHAFDHTYATEEDPH